MPQLTPKQRARSIANHPTVLWLSRTSPLPAGFDLSTEPFPANVPIVPHLDQAILDAIKAGGGFDMSFYHCGTTHCRAGWAIHLAGTAGKALEQMLDSYLAGLLIYWASAGYVPNFFDNNENALADIRKHARANKRRSRHNA